MGRFIVFARFLHIGGRAGGDSYMENNNSWRKVCSGLLLLVVFVLVIPAATDARPADIVNHWAEEEIKDWLDRGLVTGFQDGTFRPERMVTRAEFFALTNKVLGFTAEAPINFSDVVDGLWYAPEVRRAVRAGYVTGYEDNTVRPHEPLRRQEAAVILARLLNFNPVAASPARFRDGAQIPHWSKGAVDALAAQGYMVGYADASFRPRHLLTRAEMVLVLKRVRNDPAGKQD